MLTHTTSDGYAPLPVTLFHDDFDQGLQGWTGLIGNYEDSLDSLLPEYRDLRPPMLSNSPAWDTGSSGSLHGTYAMKLATRPQAGSLAVGIKRLTYRQACPVQLETYFTFKPEANELRLGEMDTHSFGILFDLQNADRRVMPHLHYLNAVEGVHCGRWQFKRAAPQFHDIGHTGKTVSHFHLSTAGWEDLPDGRQLLCYNEIATKQNWHYLRVGLDLNSMRLTALQCNDRIFDVSGAEPMTMPAMANLWCMLNVAFWIRAGTPRRSFLLIDSVLLSADLD